MSCSCTFGMTEPAKGGTIILTNNELHKIRAGKVLEYHFHGGQFKYKRITFFVSNREKVVKKKSKLAKLGYTLGEVCPLVIEKEHMQQLCGTTGVIGRMIPCDPPFEIIIASSRAWKKLRDKRTETE